MVLEESHPPGSRMDACEERTSMRANAGNCVVANNFFNSINFDNYLMCYFNIS